MLTVEGTPSAGLYLIVSGDCRLTVKRSTQAKREGRARSSTIDIAILGASQFFGEESFFVKSELLNEEGDSSCTGWITIPEYRKHIHGVKSKKDHIIRIPDTTHPHTVVALTSM